MTNFFKMAQMISDLGYDVYIFKRFADGGRGDFIPQLSRVRTIFFINRQTGRLYTCLYSCFQNDQPFFEFGAIEYNSNINQVQYGWEGYGYWCSKDGTLETSKIQEFLNEILLDIENVYSEESAVSELLRIEDFTERNIAHIVLQIGFKLKYKI